MELAIASVPKLAGKQLLMNVDYPVPSQSSTKLVYMYIEWLFLPMENIQ